MTPLADRPTGDIVVLIFAGTVALVLVGAAVAVAVLAVLHPGMQPADTLAALSDTVAAMVAMIAGYLAGRRTSRG